MWKIPNVKNLRKNFQRKSRTLYKKFIEITNVKNMKFSKKKF